MLLLHTLGVAVIAAGIAVGSAAGSAMVGQGKGVVVDCVHEHLQVPVS